MEKQSFLDSIPSRIKYYLLDWKDKNMDDYIRKYGELRLHDLNTEQLFELFKYVSIKDSERLFNISIKQNTD